MKKYKFALKIFEDSAFVRGGRFASIRVPGYSYEHARIRAQRYVRNLNRRQTGTDRIKYVLLQKPKPDGHLSFFSFLKLFWKTLTTPRE